MGSACCVAARARNIIPSRNTSVQFRLEAGQNCRRDNQGRVDDGAENRLSRYAPESNGTSGLERKGEIEECGDHSAGASQLDNSPIPPQEKAISDTGVIRDLTTPSDLSMGSSYSTEGKEFIATSAAAGPSVSRPSFSMPVTSPVSVSKIENFPSQSKSLVVDSTPSRKARRSPGHQLFRQISSGRIPGLKSPNNSISEGRQSFVLSTCSNDVTVGSQAGSSDGWSMCTFSDLVASSRRERWSFDAETLDSARGKVTRSNNRLLRSPSVDLRTCGVCLKLLTDRSPWMGQKIILSNELLVVAVLVCGHVYHAECLENMTSETDKFDPPCPLCVTGNKQALKMSSKMLRMETDSKARNRIARNRVVDSNLDGDYAMSGHWKDTGKVGKGPKMATSSSMRNSFAKPFLKRHFSLGSRSSKSVLETELSDRAPGRKGFWARYRKE